MEVADKSWKVLAILSIAFIFGFIFGCAWTLGGLTKIVGSLKIDKIDVTFDEEKFVNLTYDRLKREGFIVNKMQDSIQKNQIVKDKIGLYYDIDDFGKDNASVFVRDNNTFIKTNMSVNLS